MLHIIINTQLRNISYNKKHEKIIKHKMAIK